MQCYSSLSPLKISLSFSRPKKRKYTERSRYDVQMHNVKLPDDCESTHDDFLLKERISQDFLLKHIEP